MDRLITPPAASPTRDLDNVGNPTAATGLAGRVATPNASYRRGTASQPGAPGGGGSNFGSSSGTGLARVPPTVDSEGSAGNAGTAEDSQATALAANPLVTSLLSELADAGVSDDLVGTDEGLSTGPNQAPDLLASDSLAAALGAAPVSAEANPPGFVVVLSEPTALAVFGVGLLALGSRLRRVRRLRARS